MVVTRGGVLEIITHEQTGLLFESENKDALFEALNTLYKNPEAAKYYAKQGMELASDKFNAKDHLNHLVACLDKLGRSGHE